MHLRQMCAAADAAAAAVLSTTLSSFAVVGLPLVLVGDY